MACGCKKTVPQKKVSTIEELLATPMVVDKVVPTPAPLEVVETKGENKIIKKLIEWIS